MIGLTKAAWDQILKFKSEYLMKFPFTHTDPKSVPPPFTSKITNDFLDVVWAFQGDRRRVVLILVNYTDCQTIRDYTAKYKLDNMVVPDTLMGIPVWKSVRIERGNARSYYSWASAYEDLKFTLDANDVEKLKKLMESEREKKNHQVL